MDGVVKGHYLGKACVVLGQAVSTVEVDWSSGSVVDIVPPMAGTIVPETVMINHGGEPLDLQNLRGVWAGISNGGGSEGRKHTGHLGSRGSEGAVWNPESLDCGTQPFISKAWRRPPSLFIRP